MIISVADSKTAKHWKNIEISWEEFLQRAKTTIRTTEAVAEYKKLPKPKQDELKNVGGFVGGKLKDGKRKTGNVEHRSMLTLDMDYAAADIWEQITLFYDFACCIYSTHKHTKEKPRLRLIIPLARVVTADEYTAIGRKVAQSIGIEQFDDTTYEPARLMFWASTSSDGEFVFEHQQGEYLDPDKILASYKDWTDTSSWPVSSRQTTIIKKAITKQSDPLEKPGVIGAFCRAYSIQDAIDTFIPNIYKPSLIEGRYDYILADSTAGVLIYDDKFSFSHHATDPACSKLCNAFDVVCLHKYAELDGKAEEDTTPTKLPSFKAMQEFAITDDKVKLQIAINRQTQVNADFTAEGDEWQTGLELLKSGEIKDSLSNIILILKYDPNLEGIAYNQHSNCIDSKKELPWKQVKEGWNDSDIAGAKAYIDGIYHIWSPGKFKDALLAVASERAYHPIKEYFAGLPEWDKIERLDTLLIEYLGAEDNTYTRAVMRKTLCAAVTRIYEPGIKFDHILVLNGPQGIGKSTFFARLGGKWFSDSLTLSDMKDKTAPEKLQGNIILEMGELAGLKKVDVETVKSFITRTDDKYRPSYGMTVESHPRQCVIVGSTNCESGFLRDITGNRRFWPIRVAGGSTKKAWELNEVDQIWAEAIVKYKAGEELFLKGDDVHIAFSQQADAMESDDREGLVIDYLDRRLPETWSNMDLYERRCFLSSSEFGGSVVDGTVKRERVCTMEIWCECFCKEAVNMKKQDAYELNGMMAKIEGWERYDGNKKGNFKFPIYGSQRGYIKLVVKDK
jgi:putative DNA primase/helicase